MRATTNRNYISSGFDHQKMLNETNFFSGRFDHSSVINENLVPTYNNSVSDMLGLKDLRSTLVNPSRQPTPSIINMTPEKNFHINTELCDSESPIMNMAKTDLHGLALEFCGLNIRNTRTPKLSLDLSRAKNSLMMPTRNSGSSPPFSDSSLSTSSSNLDMGFFPHSVQTGRSDSPNSEASNSSNESSPPNHTKNFMFPQLTEQQLANLKNLYAINCLSTMSEEELMQTFNMYFQMQQNPPIISLEEEARCHRNAAVSGNVEAQFTWSGDLPKRSNSGGPYSSKVFLGGVPYDIDEDMLICSFRQFGNVKVEWPGKESTVAQPKGFAYIIFENELQVKLLLKSCRGGTDKNEGSFFYKIPSRKSKPKEVQVIPWSTNDSNYSVKTFQKLDPLKTVFVGALHGMMNAQGLFQVMDDLFEGVLYAGIDTDKKKYPIGSGRVTFDNDDSYVKAVTAAFVDIKTRKFSKKVQIDPYLEDTPCRRCKIQVGPYFCRENGCFCYFCTECWTKHHSPLRLSHKPLKRNSKHGASTNAITVSSHEKF